MPVYLYGCECGTRKEVIHHIGENPPVTCDQCGSAMHRIPQLINVNWSGLKTLSPEIQRYINDTDRRSDELAAKYSGRKE